jgi:hypothetical protein
MRGLSRSGRGGYLLGNEISPVHGPPFLVFLVFLVAGRATSLVLIKTNTHSSFISYMALGGSACRGVLSSGVKDLNELNELNAVH